MLEIFKDKSPVLINRKLIIDPFQIVVAVNNAVMCNQHNTMKTKCMATEILYNLSLSKKISQSLKEAGANDDDDDMIVAIVSKFSNVPEMKIFYDKCITGSEDDFSKLTEINNETFIKSFYKIGEVESECSSLLDSIVTRIACKVLV